MQEQYYPAINDIVTTSQATCNSHIARLNTTQINIVSKAKAEYDVIVRNLNNHRDGVITDVASFHSKLHDEMSISMQKANDRQYIKAAHISIHNIYQPQCTA